MSERVAAGLLCESGPGDRVPNRPLDQRLVDVMAALLAGLGVPPSIDLGKGPLPAPVGGRAGILAVQGIGHEDTTPTVGQVLLVNALDGTQVLLERLLEGFGEHRPAVLVPLACPDRD